MSASHEPKTTIAEALPKAPRKRDLLGNFCFYLHFAVMIYIVLGWLLPWRSLQIFYLAFLPAVALQWRFNKNACVLNNIESKLRSGQWRDPSSVEEGAWLLTLVRNVLGWQVTPGQMDAFTYAVLAALWATGLGCLL
ncbi:MAG: hypothetical protein ACLQUZ_12375 [Rhizomicrobium sp.]